MPPHSGYSANAACGRGSGLESRDDRIAHLSSWLVPVMATLYLLIALVIVLVSSLGFSTAGIIAAFSAVALAVCFSADAVDHGDADVVVVVAAEDGDASESPIPMTVAITTATMEMMTMILVVLGFTS